MLGAAGIFIPEALTKAGILNTPSWFTAGEATYFTDSTTLFCGGDYSLCMGRGEEMG
jgi:light-harvesting complex I chlorophyll a/b binding protein 2